MILKVRSAGEPSLREIARPLPPEEIVSVQTQDLIAAMRETMRDAPGVGLAAPQVGLSLQLAVIEDREEYHKDLTAKELTARERKPIPFHAIVNPILNIEPDREVEFFEGCLSLPGYLARVSRARKVKVQCLDHRGREKTIHATGWYARILQHEIDHLRGKLYIDRMLADSFTSLENFRRHWRSS